MTNPAIMTIFYGTRIFLVNYSFQVLLLGVYRNHAILSFCMMDNSVHSHECSPFWVGIFIIYSKKTLLCLLFDVNICKLLGKAPKQAFLHVIGKSNILIRWTYILVLDI